MGTHKQTFPLAVYKFQKITVLDMKEKIIRKVENGKNVYYIYKRGIFGIGRWKHVGNGKRYDGLSSSHFQPLG